MKPTRIAAKFANALLSPLGLELIKRGQDFDARLASPRHLQFLFDDLAAPMEQWIGTQQLFTPASRPVQLRPAIEQFYREYLDTPFRATTCGSRFNNLLWLYVLSSAIRPTVIFDSGTYTGGSAWALSLGSPDTPVYSFDLDISRLKLKAPGVQYIEADWTTFDTASCDMSRSLCYFDDHVDQIGRIIQAADRGVPLAIFDDDFRVTSYIPTANAKISLPKIEFALDSRLRDKEMISWSHGGQTSDWQVDRGYLDRGLSLIRATERLPDTFLITGIGQTPYRLVALK